MLHKKTLSRAFELGVEAYIENDWQNPFSQRRYFGVRLDKMDDLSAEFQHGYDAAEKDARIELRHARSCRYPGC